MKVLMLLSILFLTHNSYATIFVQNVGGKATKVAAASVKDTCGTNFVFRSEMEADMPQYLTKGMIKAKFTGKLMQNFNELKTALFSAEGTCAWVSDAEFSKL